MLNTLRRVALLLPLALVTSCLDATQVTFDITTDIPCANISGTSITVGIEGHTERGEPITVVRDCRSDGTVGAIGTYAVVPRASTDVVASIKVAAAIGTGVDVEADCVASSSYKGCVVARRRINFVAHRSLTVPIQLLLICRDVACDENTTCNRSGVCVSSRIDGSTCSTTTLLCPEPSDGLACFNDGTNAPLYCDAWCTRTAEGVRACAMDPAPGGQSYQCRSGIDCGLNTLCIGGTNGILGKCVPAATVAADDVVLCSPLDTSSPCSGGPSHCTADAGNGFFSCATADAGTDAGAFDAGRTDAGTLDASVADAGTMDAGPVDAGALDASVGDAGVDAGLDAGLADAGSTDAGSTDASVSDAGVDAGIDAGGSDAGAPDAGGDAGQADAGGLALSGLRVWLRGDIGVVTDAGKVVQWLDQTANHNDFTPETGSPPSAATAGSPLMPGVHFTQGTLLSNPSLVGIATNSARTFAVIFGTENLTARAHHVFQSLPTSSNVHIGVEANTYMTAGSREGMYSLGASWDSTVTTSLQRRSVILVVDPIVVGMPVSQRWYIDGTLDSLNRVSGTALWALGTSGMTVTRVGSWSGDGPQMVYEVLIWDRALSVSEVADLNTYLQGRQH